MASVKTEESRAIGQDKYAANIQKTGFVLEFEASRILRSHGWTVINNKYYLDDLQNTVREVDILAYKTAVVKHLRVYTTLIISCKKSEKNAWVLLSKDLESSNPNYDWQPFRIWSNDPAIAHMLFKEGDRDSYVLALSKGDCGGIIDPPDRHIFAFQEMNLENGIPKNDSNMFDSVTSLLKAEAYELGALTERRKTPSVYQFNLISLVDTELLRIDLEAGTNSVEVDKATYVTNYIIHKKKTTARVRFIRYRSFDALLHEYDRLHEVNVDFFGDYHASFFKDIFFHDDRVSVFFQKFEHDVSRRISVATAEGFVDDIKLRFGWASASKTLEIIVESQKHYEEVNENIGDLNKDKALTNFVSRRLKEIYQYAGEFKFAPYDYYEDLFADLEEEQD